MSGGRCHLPGDDQDTHSLVEVSVNAAPESRGHDDLLGNRLTRDFQFGPCSKGCALCLCQANGLYYAIPIALKVEWHTGQGGRSNSNVRHGRNASRRV